MSRLSFTHLFGGRSHEPAIALAEKIKAISPVPASKVFFTNSGSEANDTQVKIAWYFNNVRGQPKRKKIIARQRGYHGTTVAAASLSGLGVFHADFDLPIAGMLHTDCPHHWKYAEAGESEEAYASRVVRSLEDLIEREGPDTIAAFIAEPVMGAGGVLIPPATYFEKVQAVLARHDIAFIADEVICGFARTGNMVGLADLRPAAVDRHDGQGDHLGLRADGRADGAGARLPDAGGGERQARRLRARLHLFGPSAGLCGGPQDHRDLRAHADRGACAPRRADLPAAAAEPWPTIRWSARRAASA